MTSIIIHTLSFLFPGRHCSHQLVSHSFGSLMRTEIWGLCCCCRGCCECLPQGVLRGKCSYLHMPGVQKESLHNYCINYLDPNQHSHRSSCQINQPFPHTVVNLFSTLLWVTVTSFLLLLRPLAS